MNFLEAIAGRIARVVWIIGLLTSSETGAGADAGPIPSSFWENTLPEITVNDANLEEAVGVIIERFRQAYPEEETFKGIAITARAASKELTMSVRLTNVSLSDALQAVANLLWSVASFNNSVVEFVPIGEGGDRKGFLVVEVTPQLESVWGKNIHGDDGRSLLKALHIDSRHVTKVTFIKERRVLFFEGVTSELELIKAVAELAKRGLTTTQLRTISPREKGRADRTKDAGELHRVR